MGIYFQIAGSYTPLLLIGMNSSYEARVILIIEWLIAFVGIIFSAFSNVNNPSTNRIEMIIFLSMGGLIFTILPSFMNAVSTTCLTLLASGCASYVIGIFFFILGEIKPIYHSVWHLFVFIAAVIHYFTIYFYIIPMKIESY